MRAAAGYLPESFYAPDIGRMLNFLGLLAERTQQDAHDSISIIVSRTRSTRWPSKKAASSSSGGAEDEDT